MRQVLRGAALALVPGVALWAGALYLEIANPDTNPEAKNMGALLIARTTACHDPAKSVVSATLVQRDGTAVNRTPLRVVQLGTEGTFAVIGKAPAGSVIDLAVTNPEYRDYQPRVLVRQSAKGPEWAAAKRFYSTPPSEADIRSLLGEDD